MQTMARQASYGWTLITVSVALMVAFSSAAADLTVGGGWNTFSPTTDAKAQVSLSADLDVQTEPEQLALANSLSPLSGSALTIGYTLPAFGTFIVDVTAASDLEAGAMAHSLSQAEPIDVYGAYSTSFLGGEVGVFGGYSDSRSAFNLETTTTSMLGASFGYAGFYLRGAYEASGPDGLLDGRRAWQAGLGYGSDDFDLRVTYVQSAFQQGSPTELEGKQWMIGGLVQLTPSILLNANAFVIDRELVMPTVELPGSGARVGVQLRF